MASTACNYLKIGASVFFEYDTPKIVHIRSKSIGVVNRIVQLVIIGYIIGWVLVYKKGYQETDMGVSGSTTKVKGVAYPNVSNPRVPDRVWDASDIVIPAEENNAFFVMTNMIVTNNQSPGECPEAPGVKEAHCTQDSDCVPGTPYLLGHGVATGICNKPTGTCMIKAWCPIENDTLPTEDALLNGTKAFTVLVKNHVYFPLYKETRSNILEATNKTYLQGCVYDNEDNPFCPIFKLGYIVEQAQLQTKNESLRRSYDEIAKEGGVFSIRISWDCNFDFDPKKCKPAYNFDQLDKGEDSKIAKGYNFRYSNNYFNNGTEMRQQIKAYGLLFIITVNAKASKANPIPTLQNVGSGLALLALATIVCDVFVLYIHKKRKFFHEHKYEEVKNTDAYEIMDTGN